MALEFYDARIGNGVTRRRKHEAEVSASRVRDVLIAKNGTFATYFEVIF